MRGLAAINLSIRWYFRLLLDYRDIWIYPNERTMACALMPTNYFVVVVLPSRKINRVAKLMACNYQRCVFVTIFSGCKIRLRRLQMITLDKLIKKERLGRFNRFKYQNTRRDSLYRHISRSMVEARFKTNCKLSALSSHLVITKMLPNDCKNIAPVVEPRWLQKPCN